MGMALAYLLLVVAGAAGALSALVWLFQEDVPDANGRTERETYGGLQSADRSGSGRTASASVGSERWEDEAA